MSYEIYNYIFYGGAILAGVMLVVTITLFFVYKIPTVIGDLTGVNARKAIESIRNQNENSSDKTYKTGQINHERRKLTEKISSSGRLKRDLHGNLRSGDIATGKSTTQRLVHTSDKAKHKGLNETTVLGTNETTILGANETTILATNDKAVFNANETTILNNTAINNTAINYNMSAVFQIEYEITFIHTNEIIA